MSNADEEGTFYFSARFVSDVAALPRIVTLHDIDISTSDKLSGSDLSMELTAKTTENAANSVNRRAKTSGSSVFGVPQELIRDHYCDEYTRLASLRGQRVWQE